LLVDTFRSCLYFLEGNVKKLIDPPFYAGEVVKARVLSVLRFYAVVEVRRWQMRLDKELLSWEALRYTSEVLSVGDHIDVLIQSTEHFDPLGESRCYRSDHITFGFWLTRLPLLKNPWPDIEAKYSTGSVVEVEFIDYVNWYIARVRLPEGVVVEVRTNDILTLPRKNVLLN